MSYRGRPIGHIALALTITVSLALCLVITWGVGTALSAVEIWEAQDSGTEKNLMGVTSTDEDTAWAVGDRGTVSATTDGGEHWDLQHSATTARLRGVSAATQNHVWAVGDNGTILHTVDGGVANWKHQHSHTSLDLYGVTAADTRNGWAVGEKGLVSNNILHTSDGGSHWNHQRGLWFHLRDLHGVSAAGITTAWVVGERGTVWKTTNKGSNWDSQSSGTSSDLYGVSAVDANNVWAVGKGGVITHTTDGGANWRIEDSGTTSNLYGIAALDAANAWAVGHGGQILRTSDGGNTWSAQTSGTTLALGGVTVGDIDSAWAAGVGGTILHGEPQPKIVDCDPGEVVQGHTANLDITGSHTHFIDGISRTEFSGTGITVNSTHVTDDTHATASITVASDATPGSRDVNVITGSETPTALEGGLTIHEKPAEPPRLDSLAPPSGPFGTYVTIRGQHFGSAMGSSEVTFNGTPANFYTSWADRMIVCSVPYGATSGPAKVTTPAGTSNGIDFTVTDTTTPRIKTCYPTEVYQGHTIDLQIVGNKTHFQQGTSRATFSGTGITVNSTTVSDGDHATASITVAADAPPGTRDVNVITGGETPDPLSNVFTVLAKYKTPPVLRSVNPTSGPVGTFVYIVGQNFGDTRGSSTVTFNDLPATKYIFWSDSEIVCSVPMGATSGMIEVITPWGESDLVHFTVTNPSFYFAEGTTRPGFEPYLCVQNPGEAEADVSINYMRGDGATQDEEVAVGAHTRSTVGVLDALGSGDTVANDFSAGVESTNGEQIIVERPMYFDYHGAWTGGSDVIGALAPAEVFYFAEGTTRTGFETYISIQNPNQVDAEVKITYMKGDGNTEELTITVAPTSRTTVTASDTLDTGDDVAHDFSTKVECTNGETIIAERPMYFDYRGEWTGGHDVVGALSSAEVFYFAEGSCRPDFNPYLCIQNPEKEPAEVVITYMLGDGTVKEQPVTVPATSRHTVTVKDFLGEGDDAAHDFSAKVETTNEINIICERPMYFDYNGAWTGGHDVVGAAAPAPVFYFAEGSCRPNFDPYLCIQNPEQAHADIKVTYMKGDGTTQEQTLTVEATTRRTIGIKDVLGQADDAAHDFSTRVECTNGLNIICERPVYFNYNGVWTGGHDVVGFAP